MTRRRKLPLRLGLAVLLLLVPAALFWPRPEPPEADPPAVERPAAAPPATNHDDLEVEHASLGHGGTLAAALERLGVVPVARRQFLQTAGRYLDPRRLPAGTGLSAVRDASGTLLGISIRPSPDRFLRMSPDRGGEEPTLRTELLEVPVVATVEFTGGVVGSSVAQALSASDQGAQLTRFFSEIFQWDVDLLVDPRPGDAVCIVYELERLGQLPVDLPRFEERDDRAGSVLRVGRILAATYEGRMAGASAFWVEGDRGSGDYFDEQGLPLRKAFLKSPLNYRRISSRFSSARRNPVTRRVVPHHGVDFAAAAGTPVVATADGRVVSAGWAGALGNAVEIRHNGEYTTAYGHLRRFAKGIRRGAEVRQNQVIGYVGSTGRATGPHVHYTVRRYGRPIDPLRMENPPAEPLDPRFQPWLDEAMRRWGPRLGSIREDLATRLADGRPTEESPTSTRPGA